MLKKRKGVAWAVLALLAALTVGPAGVVVCFGADGHVEIESVLGCGCCDLPSGSRGGVPQSLLPSAQSSSQLSECECLDVAISLGDFDERVLAGPKLSPQTHGSVRIVCAPVPWLPAPAAALIGLSEIPSAVSPPLASLRSVILRI